ncbi:hypothetical protein, conserved [Trypanosoma cruzi]|uniref:Uncharacterized protein n=1 Tax=Trypanosoma cruzi (strain CL Brener) TaxID=353153 RepID=Q4DSZ7_TRYCC|nr:hypothetical protein, conserved [Trypanosoma cruzi]EAN95653.1 hypothetical protein, conserved [Trypanosoma cruzi]|eukprot:XP_817504.1 hypothetical protein [Trypanosoma cruzi strain CL Brener]
MFVGRWVYNKGQTVGCLSHLAPRQKRDDNEADAVANTLYGCVLFLKDDVVNCFGGGGGEIVSVATEGDLMNTVLQWARGGRGLCGEVPEVPAPRASLPFYSTSSGPWFVIERCVGDPCSFGVIAGFVCRRVHNGDDVDGVGGCNPDQESCGNGFLWEWGELINCTTISQLSLYLDSLPLKSVKET